MSVKKPLNNQQVAYFANFVSSVSLHFLMPPRMLEQVLDIGDGAQDVRTGKCRHVVRHERHLRVSLAERLHLVERSLVLVQHLVDAQTTRQHCVALHCVAWVYLQTVDQVEGI
jgi:hypothetical protein